MAVRGWEQRLRAALSRSIEARNQTMGHLEAEIQPLTRASERVALEEASQKKADQTPPVYPVCGGKLSSVLAVSYA